MIQKVNSDLLQIRLTKKQSEGLRLLENENYTEILFDGGVRAGKTLLIVIYLLKFALTVTGVFILIGRRFFDHCRKSLYLQTIEPLLSVLPPQCYQVNKQDWIIRFQNGSQIWLSGFDDSRRITEIMGREYLIAFLNEATEIEAEMVTKIKTRLAQKVKKNNGEGYYKPRLFFDCNPVMPEFYLNQRFKVDRVDGRRKRLNWSTYDNRENLTEDYLSDLENSLIGPERERLIMGHWVGEGETVYRNISEAVIVEDYKMTDFRHLVAGIDWGYISAFNLWGIANDGKEATCIAEVESKGKITSEFLEEIEETIQKVNINKNDFVIYCDHEKDRIEEAKRKGFSAKLAHKNISAGDSTVNSMNIKILKNCPNTYRSMRFLQNDKDRNGQIIEGKHISVDAHSADAARYALHSYRMDYGKQSNIITNSTGLTLEDILKAGGII